MPKFCQHANATKIGALISISSSLFILIRMYECVTDVAAGNFLI